MNIEDINVAYIDDSLHKLSLFHEIDNAEHIRRGSTASRSEWLTTVQQTVDLFLDARLELTNA